MAGKVIRVIPLTTYVFTQYTATGQINSIARGIDVSNYKSGDLVVRVHAAGSAQASSSVEVSVIQDGNTSEDPTAVFDGAVVATKSISNTDITTGTFGKVWVAALDDAPWGSMLAVTLFAKNGSPGQAMSVKLSADIVLRDA